MRNFFKILSYGKPYQRFVYTYLVFIFLSILFGLFTLGFIMPFLDILFKPEKLVTMAPEKVNSFDTAYNYLMYHLSGLVQADAKIALLYVCIMVIIAAVLKNLFLYLSRYYLIPFRTYTIRDIRNEFYKKVLRLPMSYFTEERKGDLISRISNDINEVQNCLNSSLEAVFKEPISILLSLISLLLISPHLTVIILITLPIAAWIITSIGKSVKVQSTRNQEKQAELMSNVEETLSGIRIIKAFHNAAYFLRKFMRHNDLLTRISVGINRRKDLSSPLSETLALCILVIVLYVGGNLILDSDYGLPASGFILYLGIFSQIIPPAKSFFDSFYSIQKGLAAKERIDEILDSNEKIVDAPDAQAVRSFQAQVEFRHVSFRYEDKNVLENINLTIYKGETVALIGPSGGGKSTLADLLIRFYDVTEGEILIDGKNIRQIKTADLRKLMGVVTQESILFNDTVYNNIAFGNHDVGPEEIEAAARIANAHEFIAQLDRKYQTNIGERGSKLSGGQRQRIAIARAVLRNPELLILDEATSALDNASERLVQDALEKLMKGRTSIVIAHRLSTIQHADKIVVLQKGKIVQVGKHQELVQQPGLYRELYEVQQHGE